MMDGALPVETCIQVRLGRLRNLGPPCRARGAPASPATTVTLSARSHALAGVREIADDWERSYCSIRPSDM